MDQAANPSPGHKKHPEHRLLYQPAERRVTARIGDLILADSNQAVTLEEGRYPTVYYFPRVDVRMDWMQATNHSTYCPFKGHASYWSLQEGDYNIENVMWSYPTPYDESMAIKEKVAFYTEHITVEPDS